LSILWVALVARIDFGVLSRGGIVMMNVIMSIQNHWRNAWLTTTNVK